MDRIQSDINTIAGIDAVPSMLEVICKTTGMGFAAIARVTDEKWVACAVRDEIQFGLIPGGELVLQSTICHEIRQTHIPVVIDEVASDPEFCGHHTPAQYGFQSYISVPIFLNEGEFFGTLCAIDPNPAKIKNAETVGMFNLFAQLIAMHIHSADNVRISKERLEEELQTSKLREEFIAILGHDLRNPVSAISNVGQLLMRMPLDDRTSRLAKILQDSTFRMKGLIDNMLDFARGHLGGGIKLNYRDDVEIETLLKNVMSEIMLVNPGREVISEFHLQAPVRCDANRISQLFSNLLGNAITHGSPDKPIAVNAQSDSENLIISVSNAGTRISEAEIADMFKPFSRGVRQNKEGLGLGLYISQEIAKAHQGKLTVHSDDEITEFRLTIPCSLS